MLGLDGRTARAVWTVLLIALAVAVTYLIRRTLLVFVFALLLAYLLSPLVDLVDRFLAGRFPRNLSLAVVYLALVGVVSMTLVTVGSRIAQEAASLADRLPQYLQNPRWFQELPIPALLEPYRAAAIESLKSNLEANAQEILPVLGKAGQRLLAVFGNLIFVILVPILSFFFLKDSRGIRLSILDQFGERSRGAVEDVLADIHLLLAQYMRALVLLSLVTLVVYWIYLWTTGVPYSLLLAGVAGGLEFIPMLGPLLAAATILLVAGFAGYQHLLWIVVFLVAFRLFQDYVVQPYLLGSGVELPPAAVIFGVLAGEQIGGAMGMFLSIPVLASLRVIYVRFRKARSRRQDGA